MRRTAASACRTGAIAAIALLAAAPADGAPASRPDPAGPAAKRKKPKPVKCRATQVTVVVRGRTRCSTAPRSAAATQLALARAVLGRNVGPLRARGRRIGPIWQAGGGRIAPLRARLLRALPKALAFAERRARASARVPGDPPSCATGPATRSSSSFDGFSVSVGSDGDVSMSASASGGYRISVSLGGMLECADLDLPECPVPDGRLEGTDGRRSELGMRITRDGALVQSLRTTVRSRQALKGKVADDAKLDHMDVEDVVNETLTFQLPGRTVVVRVAMNGSARLNMRSGAITGARVRTSVGFSGTTPGGALAAAGRTVDEYAQKLPDLVRKEGEHLRRRERLWHNPNRCAKLVLDPATDTRPVQRLVPGTLAARVEAKAGGLAADARWEVRSPENGSFSPTAAGDPSVSFSFTPTGRDGQRIKTTMYATSTAGVAETPWSQEIVDARYFKLDDVVYTDQLSLTGTPLIGSCQQSTSQTNTSSFSPSGAPFDGAMDRTGPTAPVRGGLTMSFTIHKSAAFNGCKLSDDGTEWLSCQFGSTGTEQYGHLVDVELGPGTATVSFFARPITIGDVDPVMTTCVPSFGTPGVIPEVRQSVPASAFELPGRQSLAFDVPGSWQPASGGTLTSSARFELTFHRVNADGSPYTG